jgi:AraC-like DNA-binding protein
MFKSKTGINLQQYIKTVRMLRAYHLVRYSNTHIYEIGGDLGFQNGEHFSSQFRKIIGFTPSALRSGNCDEIVPACLQTGWSA